MSIGKRIAEAIDKMAQNDVEGALLPVSAAIDATATKHFKKRGKNSYKEFIHENFGLITKVTFRRLSIQNLKLEYKHPDLKPDPDGLCTIEEVLYHVVRCGLLHDAALPSTIKFVDEGKIASGKNGVLILPSSLISGLVAAVVVCPENIDQHISDTYRLNFCGFQIKLNDLWGKKIEFENLLAALKAIYKE